MLELYHVCRFTETATLEGACDAVVRDGVGGRMHENLFFDLLIVDDILNDRAVRS
jgi:hypothetical protein